MLPHPKFQAPSPPSLSGGSLATGPVLGHQPGWEGAGPAGGANFSSRPLPLGALSPTAPAAPCRGPSPTLPSAGCQPTPTWLPWCHLMGILLQAGISVGILSAGSPLPFPPSPGGGPVGCGKELSTQESAGPGQSPCCSASPAL